MSQAETKGGHFHAVRFYEDDTSCAASFQTSSAKELPREDGLPHPERFRDVATAALRRVDGTPGRTIRAYGEMVDLLWKDGMSAASIKLEMLWNTLAGTHDFSLLCGYAMGSFYKDVTVDDICRHHTHRVSDTGETSVMIKPLS